MFWNEEHFGPVPISWSCVAKYLADYLASDEEFEKTQWIEVKQVKKYLADYLASDENIAATQ